MIALDSSAIVAILKQEEDASRIALVLAEERRLLMSAGSYIECAIVADSKLGVQGLKAFDALLAHLKVELVPVDERQARLGVEAHRRFGRGSGHPAKLNFGDCFSYALARSRGLPLLFKGGDFVHTDIQPALKPA